MKVKIDDIKFVGDSYPRDGLIPEVVNQYSLNLDALPPIVVSEDLTLVDGYHRLEAHRKDGRGEIEARVIRCPKEQILYEAAKRNATHGRQLTIGEKRYLADVFFKEGLRETRIAKTLALHKSTLSKWLKKERHKADEERNKRILHLWLACHTQREISSKIGLSQQEISKITQKLINQLREAPPAPGRLQLYNVWNFPGRDPKYGYDIEGKGPPGQAIENLLFYYTNPFDLIVDPMAGGGSTIDVCKFMCRRFLAYDVEPVREGIEKWDVTKSWPKKAKNCDFIYLDPPYYKKIDYGGSSIPTLTKDLFLKGLSKIARNCYRGLKKGGHLSLAAADYLSYDGDDTPVLAHEYATEFQKVGFIPVNRVSCPVPTEQWSPTDVDRAKEKKIMLEIARDLYIFQKETDNDV